jgi:hypothetical protein
MWLVQADVPWACFGFEVTNDGWSSRQPPIAAWTIGKRGRAVVHYHRQRGGRVCWQQVPHRLSYAGHPLTGSAEELHAAVDQLDADTVPGPATRRSSPAASSAPTAVAFGQDDEPAPPPSAHVWVR